MTAERQPETPVFISWLRLQDEQDRAFAEAESWEYGEADWGSRIPARWRERQTQGEAS